MSKDIPPDRKCSACKKDIEISADNGGCTCSKSNRDFKNAELHKTKVPNYDTLRDREALSNFETNNEYFNE